MLNGSDGSAFGFRLTDLSRLGLLDEILPKNENPPLMHAPVDDSLIGLVDRPSPLIFPVDASH